MFIPENSGCKLFNSDEFPVFPHFSPLCAAAGIVKLFAKCDNCRAACYAVPVTCKKGIPKGAFSLARTIKEICSGLTGHVFEPHINQNSTIVSLRYVTRDSFSIFLPYCLYIGYASRLPAEIMTTETLNFLILRDTALPRYLLENPNFNTVVVEAENPEKVDLFGLYNQIQNLLSIDPAALACSYDMTRSLSHGETVQGLLAIAYQYLENPVMLTNIAHLHVAHVFGRAKFSEPVWEHYVEKGYCCDEMVAKVNADLAYRKALSDGKYPATVDYTDIMNYRQMTMPVRLGGVNVAFLSVLEVSKPFTSSTGDILEAAADAVTIKIRPDINFNHSRNPAFDMLMRYLLTTPKPNEIYVTLQLRRCGVQLERPFTLFSLEDTQGMDVEQKMPYITTVIDRYLPSQHVFLFENKTLVLHHSPTPPELLMDPALQKEFCGLLHRFHLVCGVSRVFGSICDLSVAYDQTIKAIQFGEIYHPQESMHQFENYIMENLLSTFLEHDHINSLIDPKLKELIRCDKLKNGDLTPTLRAYLQFDCDMKKTSESLHVHYNTLKYRLQRIRDTYYMPLSDTQYIFQLKLSFLALDLDLKEKAHADAVALGVPQDMLFDS